MALALDGSVGAQFTAGASSGTITLTTTNTNDVVVVVVAYEQSAARTVSTVTATGLTFAQRGIVSANGAGTFAGLEIWWAPAAAIQTAKVITVTLSGAADNCCMMAWGVNGAFSITAPWDGAPGLPAPASSSTGLAAAPNFSTVGPDDFVVAVGMNTTPTPLSSALWTPLTSQQAFGGAIFCSTASFYEIVSASQSNAPSSISVAQSSGRPTLILVDAISGDAPFVSVALTGVSATGSVGSLTPVSSVTLTGVSAVMAGGKVQPPVSGAAALTGISATATAARVGVFTPGPEVAVLAFMGNRATPAMGAIHSQLAGMGLIESELALLAFVSSASVVTMAPIINELAVTGDLAP